jgi:hypothetical protein
MPRTSHPIWRSSQFWLARLPNALILAKLPCRHPNAEAGLAALLAPQSNAFRDGITSLPLIPCTTRSGLDSAVALDMQVTFHFRARQREVPRDDVVERLSAVSSPCQV